MSRALPIVVLLSISLVGCEGNPVANRLDFLASCVLEGSFRTTNLTVTSGTTPTFVRDLGRAGARLEITFNNSLFTSTFAQPGSPPFTQAGPFNTSSGFLILGSQPVLPFVVPGVQRFNCEQRDGLLSLTSDDLLFDFGGSGTAQPGRFQATFVRF